MSGGRVYLVGAGPGDPGLLTLRGRDALAGADVVVYDALICSRLLDHARPAAERIYVGKRAADHALSQEEINRLLVDRARAGKTVVRLKGGDPFVFGRGGEEALALAAAGIGFEVVPGVTAGVAGPAYAGIPVTHRGLAGSVVLVTGHQAADGRASEIDWAALAAWKGTRVFYMGAANLGEICRRLIEHELPADVPAAVIQWGATPRQKVAAGTVGTLPDLAEQAKLGPPAIIVVGPVVALRDRLAWFERRCLLGRRVVVTRPRGQGSELTGLLEQAGAEVIECPAIRIEPPADRQGLRRAVAEAGSFDWILFTSVNAVAAFEAELGDLGLDGRSLAGARLAVVGPATARRLAQCGLRADAQAEPHTTAALVRLLADRGELAGRRVLAPRSDVAPADLAEALAAAGAKLTQVVAYRTVPDASAAADVAELLDADQVDWLTFTSPSTVDGFFAAVPTRRLAGRTVRLASIGPVTSRALEQRGLSVAVEAQSHTSGGLAEAIIEDELRRKDRS